MSKAERLVTPLGDLLWVFITGQGKKDLNDNDRFVASIRFPNDSPQLAEIVARIETYWEENKGKGWKLKSNSIKEELYPESHDKAGEPTGHTLINFWTGIAYPDGSPKVIKTMNAKGAEVSLGGRKIGNGSRGTISGAMAIYDNGVAARGVTIYLNAIQLSKFIEFTDDAGFEEVDEEGGGFTGEDLNSEGFAAVDESESGDAPTGEKPSVKL